ncbi:MAG: hypothetical protein EB164_04015 [Thaumarchaeota archaeon]|nr:hypothetical protein [Nitrososphaerota archaeon]
MMYPLPSPILGSNSAVNSSGDPVFTTPDVFITESSINEELIPNNTIPIAINAPPTNSIKCDLFIDDFAGFRLYIGISCAKFSLG